MAKGKKLEEESFQSFAKDSSIHGMQYVGSREHSLPRRGIWLLLMMGAFAYTVGAGYLFLQDYTKKLTKTKIKVKNVGNLTFPTVTICNRNQWKASGIVPHFMTDEERKQQNQLMTDVFSSTSDTIPDDKYNWSSPEWAPYAIAYDTQEDQGWFEEYMKNISHGLSETYLACTIKGNDVPCEEMLSPVLTDTGYCYQFNSDGSFQTNAAGNSGGITLFLDVMADEYYLSPYSFSEGFFIAIHDSKTVPLLAELSYGAQPGMETNLMVHRVEINRQPPPADQSDCFDTETKPNPLVFYPHYSFTGCFEECRTAYVINKCNCRDILQPALYATRLCNFKDMLQCSKAAQFEFTKSSEHLDRCNCKSPCKEVNYHARVSTYKFPNYQYTKTINSTFNNSVDADWMRNNMAYVRISYGQLSYESLDEEIAYSLFDLIANLGGTLGVCLGASILSLIELLEYIIMKLSKCFLTRSLRQEKVTPE